MGFYSAATLLQDAKRGGRDLQANPPCVQHSQWLCTVEADRLIRIGLRYVKSLREAAVAEMLAARSENPFASLDDFLRRTDFTATERRALSATGAFNCFTHDRRAALWHVEAAWSDNEALFKQFAESYADASATRPSSEWHGRPAHGFGNRGVSPLPRPDSPLAPMSRTEELQADFAGLGLTSGEHPIALFARATA